MNFMVQPLEMGLLMVFLVLFFLSLLGVMLAKLVKLPGVVGILLVGVLWRLMSDSLGLTFIKADLFNELAKLGVAFLLFLLGIEFSLGSWGRWRWRLVSLAFIQIGLTAIFGFGVIFLLGVGINEALILALGLSLSSTAVVVKVLIDKGQIQSLSGQILVLWLLIQDIAVVPMFLFFSFWKSIVFGTGLLAVNWIAWVGIILLVVVTWFLVKPVFDYFAKKWGREALILGAAILGLGMGVAFESAGLSLPLGAFIAGVMVSKVNEKHEVLSKLSVMRDLFAGIFFLSLGYLVSLGVVLTEWKLVVGLVVVFGVIKMLVAGFGLSILKIHRRVAVGVAIGLFDAGEFALLLGQEGWRQGIFDLRYLSILTGVLVLSMFLMPIIAYFENSICFVLGKLGWGSDGKFFREDFVQEGKGGSVVVFGGGRAGKIVIEKLIKNHRRVVVVDYDLRVIEGLLERKVAAIYGDALDEEVINLVKIETAKAVVITIPEERVVSQLIKMVRQKSFRVNLVVRAHRRDEAMEFKKLGASRVILAEESVGRLIYSYLRVKS
jgi:monovalent cation:H+ antiporter-2, CPA2 family